MKQAGSSVPQIQRWLREHVSSKSRKQRDWQQRDKGNEDGFREDQGERSSSSPEISPASAHDKEPAAVESVRKTGIIDTHRHTQMLLAGVNVFGSNTAGCVETSSHTHMHTYYTHVFGKLSRGVGCRKRSNAETLARSCSTGRNHIGGVPGVGRA